MPISWRHVTKYMRYVPHALAEDYARLGWCVSDAFDATPHAAYSVICAWLCACPPIEPRDLRR
jgi:hypothetical protein